MTLAVATRAVAPVEEVIEIGGLLDAWVTCRCLGHAWEPWSPPADAAPVSGVREWVRCIRCYTERASVFSPFTGERLGKPVYKYPEGYQLGYLVERATWRVEWHRRTVAVAKERARPTKARKAAGGRR